MTTNLHTAGELAGAVGGGKALDQLQPAITVLEREELLAVDRRPHVERAQRIAAGPPRRSRSHRLSPPDRTPQQRACRDRDGVRSPRRLRDL
jgi:hypothetical protein